MATKSRSAKTARRSPGARSRSRAKTRGAVAKVAAAKRVAKPARKTPAPPKNASKKTTAKKLTSKQATRTKAPRVVEMALATFAHEVRTPLTGILAISELLATSGLPERERQWVETIKASAEHLAALATLFVDAAKGRAVGLGLRRDFFDLHALAAAAGDSLAGRAAAKGLAVQVENAAPPGSYVLGDAVRLRAALENLIDNAVKFSEQGDVELHVTLAPQPRERLKVAFAVSDRGVGLTMAEVKRLFRPFSQANVAIARRFGGAGLGLASVRALARAMKGDVTARLRRGGGATFTLAVQLDRASARDAALLGVPEGAPNAQPMTALRVLCVEDNPFGRVILNTIMTELGHHAEFVGRGETVCERLGHGDIDAVLMDIVLPGIDGIETIRRIRALAPPLNATPIVGLSGRGEDEAAARAAGADAFLLKPVSPRALVAALSGVAASRR